MSDPIYPTDKDALLQQMDESWLRLNGLVETLTPVQLTEPTDAAGWSVRDHLDHLRAWESGILFVFQRQSRAEGMGIAEDVYASAEIDAFNEAIRQTTIGVPLSDVRRNLATTHQQLRAVVAATPSEDRHKPYTWFLPDNADDDDDRSMLHKVAGNSSQHMDEHLPWMLGIIGPPVP